MAQQISVLLFRWMVFFPCKAPGPYLFLWMVFFPCKAPGPYLFLWMVFFPCKAPGPYLIPLLRMALKSLNCLTANLSPIFLCTKLKCVFFLVICLLSIIRLTKEPRRLKGKLSQVWLSLTANFYFGKNICQPHVSTFE